MFLCGFFFPEKNVYKTDRSFVEGSSLYFFRSDTPYFRSMKLKSHYHLLKVNFFKNSHKYALNIGVIGATGLTVPYAYIPKLYYKMKKNLILGTKALHWFEAEKLWLDGLWSALFRFDPTDVVDQGPVGLIGAYKKFQYFLQTALIPGLRSFAKEESQKIVPRSPWSQRPPDKIFLLGDERELLYKLTFPDARKFLWAPGAGIFWKSHSHKKSLIGPSFGRTTFSLGYALKPSFDPLFKAFFVLPISSPQPNMDVEILPDIFYHHLLSVEASQKNRKVHLMQNFTYEHPLLGTFNKDKAVLQKRPPSFLSTSYISYRASNTLSLFSSYRYVYQNFSKVNAGRLLESELFASPFIFFNALSLGAEKQFPFKSFSGKTTLKIVYDFKQRGTLINWKTVTPLTKQLSAFFLVELIGLLGEEQKDPDRVHFLSQFRAHDRIQGGIRYVF